jgi:putative sterol carrier protein
MTATEAFFNGLAERGFEPLLQRATGTVRLDLDGDHWYLDVAKGKVQVSRTGEPDVQCVVRTDPDTFERVASGQSNAMASMLRNEIMFDGDPVLVVLLQKLFPWPMEGAKQ